MLLCDYILQVLVAQDVHKFCRLYCKTQNHSHKKPFSPLLLYQYHNETLYSSNILFNKVQIAILQSDVQSKSDKSPVTVADYGSQALVSYALQRELPSELFSMVAEEISARTVPRKL
uniref:Uncharacterized protein n=1 Tax=Salix viminalis TaxID=40686 RepID=A0A6N2LA86_SALVM